MATVIGKSYPTHDHIIPLSKGGEESYENAQLLCWDCNNKKHTDDTDYRPEQNDANVTEKTQNIPPIVDAFFESNNTMEDLFPRD